MTVPRSSPSVGTQPGVAGNQWVRAAAAADQVGRGPDVLPVQSGVQLIEPLLELHDVTRRAGGQAKNQGPFQRPARPAARPRYVDDVPEHADVHRREHATRVRHPAI
jgi:hypothetical protein